MRRNCLALQREWRLEEMSYHHNTYFNSVDWAAMQRTHPIGDDFLAFAGQSRDAIRQHQELLFSKCVARAWQIPFYQRLWGNAGIEPGDIKGLETLAQLPIFDKADIMESIALAPPFGDFGGLDSAPGGRPPVIMHTTSGTTGTPQVLLFGAKSREVQNLMLGRTYRFQGLRPDDVVHSVYGHGMINGGHYVRESVIHWTSAIFLSAGTGIETRSVRQVELMRDFGATVIVGFADYIKKLAKVAVEQGIDPVRDLKIRMISGHLGREDKESLSRAWGGVDCFDWYGVGDTGIIAGEGPDRDGLYVMEDAQYLEVCDIDTGLPVQEGETGDMVVTCLYKDDLYPIIRFNTHDVTRVLPGQSSLGMNFQRIEGFLGRSDNMVKIRGINIFPQAMGPILEEDAQFAGEFICKAVRDASGRDEFVVVAEVNGTRDDETLERFKALLKQRLGIDCGVELVNAGELAPLTQTEVRQKPIRLIDERFE
jgi:phenylacetate-CoA ligase